MQFLNGLLGDSHDILPRCFDERGSPLTDPVPGQSIRSWTSVAFSLASETDVCCSNRLSYGPRGDQSPGSGKASR